MDEEVQEGTVQTDDEEDVFSDSVVDAFRRSESSSRPTTVSDGTSSCGSPLAAIQGGPDLFNYNTDALVEAILQPEKEFMDFILSSVEHCPKENKIPTSTRRSSSTRPSVKVGLDHLDNLCKLMEQLTELKEANLKLRKRVQYLEDMKTLHDMHRDLHPAMSDIEQKLIKPMRSRTEPKVVNIELNSSKNCRHSRRGLKKCKTQPLSRERSKSVGDEELLEGIKTSKKRFPKWSRKVKEALGWEKIESRQESKRSRSTKEYAEGSRRVLSRNIVGTLNIPVYTDYLDNEDVSPAESFTSESLAGGGINSIDDVRQIDGSSTKRPTAGSSRRTLAPSQEYVKRRKSTPSPTSIVREAVREELRLSEGLRLKCQTLESDVNANQSKDGKEDGKKSSKGAWVRMKTMIGLPTRRDSFKHRFKKSVNYPQQKTDRDPKSEISVEISAASDGEVENSKEQANENKRRSSDFTSYGQCRDGDTPESFKSDGSSQRFGRNKQTSSETGTTDSSQGQGADRKHGQKPLSIKFPTVETGNDDHPELEEDCHLGTPTSPSFYRKLKWNKMKKVFSAKKDDAPFSSRSVPSSPTSVTGGQSAFDFDNIHYEDEEMLDVSHSITQRPHGAFIPSSQSDTMETLMHELQSGLSDDFSKKIEEWERLRFANVVKSEKTPQKRRNKSEKSVNRCKGEDKPSKQRTKDLSWLEKELHKVEREKQRLAKERQKYDEKASRLEKLRNTVVNAKNTQRNEVFVKTSAGEFRFEGISDAFTKKLYEWELKRGVIPELSTLALLDASRQKPVSEKGILQRGHSRSDTSIVEAVGQPSQTSSNSLPSLKQQLEVPQGISEEKPMPSRSNSVPELSVFNGHKEILNIHHRVLAPDDSNLLQPYAPPEITRLIDSESEESHSGPSCSKIDATEPEDIAQNTEDSYYSLVEENMILLERLKAKEEICRKLESELVALDQKMSEMKRRHEQEMERYREKLWEVHRPGSKPQDLEGSLQLISELKRRIEELERSTERLKCDRQTLEDSFRYHSEQQAKLAVDLSEKMRELQEASIANSVCSESDRPARRLESIKWDPKKVQRLHDLSTTLLQQADHLEEALAERTHQVCHLRWELLNRDVSTMRLETELQRARWQGSSCFPFSSSPSCKYSQQRSWSSSDGLSFWSKHERPDDEWIQERLSRFSSVKYENWPTVQYEPTKLSNTIHELKIELLQMSSPNDNESDVEERSDSQAISEQSELVDLNQSFPSHTGTGRSSPVEVEVIDSLCSSPRELPYPRTAPQITVRRNSADNFSSVSGPECSESSSVNENVAFVLRLPSRRWTRSADNVSTSSESSFIEEEKVARSWCSPRGRRRAHGVEVSEDNSGPHFATNDEDTHSCKKVRQRREHARHSYKGRGGTATVTDMGSEYSSEEVISHRSLSCTGSPLSPRECIRTFCNQAQISKLSISEEQASKNVNFENSSPPKNLRESDKKDSEFTLKPQYIFPKSGEDFKESLTVANSEESTTATQTGKFNLMKKPETRTGVHPIAEKPGCPKDILPGIDLKSTITGIHLTCPKKSVISCDNSINSSVLETSQTKQSRSSAVRNILGSNGNENESNQEPNMKEHSILTETETKQEISGVQSKFSSLNISATTPVIKSRSPRRLKIDNQNKIADEKETPLPGKISIKMEQLDTKKPASVMGSPLVKSLIQKYNQKAQEKITDPLNNSARNLGTKETEKNLLIATPISEQNSGSLQFPSSPLLLRSEALLKAKEDFIKTSSPLILSTPAKMEDVETENQRFPTRDDDSRSISSGKSMDSASIVTYKTGEICRETRQARKISTNDDKEIPGRALSGSESQLSGDQFKPRGFLNLKLRRSQKKKDVSVVGQLCRQSLLLNIDSDEKQRTDPLPESPQAINPKSCPSSPEAKVKSKGGWFQKSIFRR